MCSSDLDTLLAELLQDMQKHHVVLRTEEAPFTSDAPQRSGTKPLKAQLDELEKRIIRETLSECQFNKKKAAQRLGISVNTLWRKLGPSNICH